MRWFSRQQAEGRHHVVPLVADLVEIGVTYTAIQNFDLYVVFGWIAPCDRGGGQQQCRTGRGVSIRVVHGLNLHGGRLLCNAEHAIVRAKYANRCLEKVPVFKQTRDHLFATLSSTPTEPLHDRGVDQTLACGIQPFVKKTTFIFTIVMAVLCAIVYGKELIGVRGSLAVVSQLIFFFIVTTFTYWMGFGMLHEKKIVLSRGMATRNLGAALAPLFQ